MTDLLFWFFTFRLVLFFIKQHSDGRGIGVVILSVLHIPEKYTKKDHSDGKAYPDEQYYDGHIKKEFVQIRKYESG